MQTYGKNSFPRQLLRSNLIYNFLILFSNQLKYKSIKTDALLLAIKDIDGKLMVEMIIVTFLNTVSTADFLTLTIM